MITYDDAQSFAAKAVWAKQQGMAGFVLYSTQGDTAKGQLIAAARAPLDGASSGLSTDLTLDRQVEGADQGEGEEALVAPSQPCALGARANRSRSDVVMNARSTSSCARRSSIRDRSPVPTLFTTLLPAALFRSCCTLTTVHDYGDVSDLSACAPSPVYASRVLQCSAGREVTFDARRQQLVQLAELLGRHLRRISCVAVDVDAPSPSAPASSARAESASTGRSRCCRRRPAASARDPASARPAFH